MIIADEAVVVSEHDKLHACQRRAILAVRKRAAAIVPSARVTIRAVLERSGLSEDLYLSAEHKLRHGARIALHFHPERLCSTGQSVAEGLLQSGLYKNQFETGISGGSPSAFVGGERDLWERDLFAAAYHGADVTGGTRPKYGALEVVHHPDGPAPRFGSSYFVLRHHVVRRATLTWGGSNEEDAPGRTTTMDALEPLMAPLLLQLAEGQGAFGVDNLSIAHLFDRLTCKRAAPDACEGLALGRALDSFVEVQVHGDVCLRSDVEAVVGDPAFLDHPIGDVLAELARSYDFPLSWHPGFTLPVTSVPDTFRGYRVRRLAERIVGDGDDRTLDAAKIGAAANSLLLHPSVWDPWGSLDDVLTQFRRLWHVVVLLGRPAATLGSSGP
jgi:hypothetical protein